MVSVDVKHHVYLLTRFMMPAKRPVRYTCTIRLVRRIVNLLTEYNHCVYDDLALFQRFFVVFLDAVRSLRQSMSLMTRIDKGEFVCSCWWPVLACVLLYFFRAFFCFVLFLHFMVYSVETVTEAF